MNVTSLRYVFCTGVLTDALNTTGGEPQSTAETHRHTCRYTDTYIQTCAEYHNIQRTKITGRTLVNDETPVQQERQKAIQVFSMQKMNLAAIRAREYTAIPVSPPLTSRH